MYPFQCSWEQPGTAGGRRCNGQSAFSQAQARTLSHFTGSEAAQATSLGLAGRLRATCAKYPAQGEPHFINRS